MPTDNRIKICEQISEDAKNDAEQFDGKPFNGKTVAEYFGYHGASISALANLVKSLLEEMEEKKPPEITKEAAERSRS